MFRRLHKVGEPISVFIDGERYSVPRQISVAAAMLYLDLWPFRRTRVSQSPRAPFCMMGSCFECLLEIDDRRNQRACQIEVSEGMQIRRQLDFIDQPSRS